MLEDFEAFTNVFNFKKKHVSLTSQIGATTKRYIKVFKEINTKKKK